MEDTTKVVHHIIGDTAPWPENVASIWSLLSHPLPQHLISDDMIQERMSSGASELYKEALQSPLLILGNQETTKSSQCPRLVTGVIDTILSCVRMVKTASLFGKGDEQARISWISVLTILGIVMSEDTFVMEDVRFLKARTTKKSKVRDIEELEGRASILISSLLPNPSPPYSTAGCDTMEMDRSEEGDSSSSSESKKSLLPMNVAFDAHVLPGRGKRVNCFIPIVCAAPENEIEELLTSIVCQRYVLNISIPIVGVSFSTSGTTATIVIGWADYDPNVGLTVHLAHTHGNGIPRPSIGLFDLLDPTSVLYFGQFILGLQTQTSYIKEHHEGLRIRNFCWRLDHNYEHANYFPSAGLSKIEAVEAWVTEISRSLSDSATSLNAVQPSGVPNMYKRTNSSNNKAVSSKHSGDHSSKIPDDQLLKPTPIHVSSNKSAKSDSNKTCSNELQLASGSRDSASNFAKLDTDLASMDKGTERWLWERNTLRLHRIKLHQPDWALGKQVNEMIDKYDYFTRISMPESWTNIKNIPKRDPVFDQLRQELYQDCAAYRFKNPSSANMEEEVSVSITNHLSSLFSAVATARSCQELATIDEGREISMRSVWDGVMRAMCCDAAEPVSPNYFLEKTIPLPKNQAVELAQLFPYQDQSQTWVRLLSFQKPASTTLPIHVQTAFRETDALAFEMARATSPIVTREERLEPGQARADGLCCMRYRLQQKPMIERRIKPARWWMSPFLKSRSNKKSQCKGKKLDKGVDHSHCLMCPEVMESGPSSSNPDVDNPNPFEIDLPLIFAEFKSNSSSISQAFHQGQMYVTFGVEFLAALGIFDCPVWCLVTAGVEGTIIMAWKSTKSVSSNTSIKYNIILDRYTRKFNLTEPLQALQMMACVHRLYRSQQDLQKQVKACLDKNPSLLSNPTELVLRWMLTPQDKSET